MCSVPEPKKKACDGRCLGGGGGCKTRQAERVVIVACGGSICLLNATTSPLMEMREGGSLFASPASFNAYITVPANLQFEQVVLIGSANDLAWMNAMLPSEISSRVVAEMHYPLRGEWLHEPGLGQLKAALTPLMQ